MPSCEIPVVNANSQEIQKLLREAKTIAVVGLSNEPEKDSYEVAAYLQSQGYKIIPVNPKYPKILGETSYPTLKDIPQAVDIVDIFRRPEAIPELAQATLALSQRPKAFWMQKGISHNESAKSLRQAGILVIQNQCIKVLHGAYMAIRGGSIHHEGHEELEEKKR
jgi:predicted CoA-binding protein